MKLEAGRPTYARIDLATLRSNLRSSREFIGTGLKYMAVVKADAYGHGAVECSRALASEGIDWLGVAMVEEAVELRGAGIRSPILCLGGFWRGQESALIEGSITPVVFDLEQAARLAEAGLSKAEPIRIHVKIDTGMGRVGVPFSEVVEFARTLKRFNNLELEGLMSHLAAADDPGEDDFTRSQISDFRTAVDVFRAEGFKPKITGIANSPGSVAHTESRPDMVRLGGILYGLGGDTLPPGIPAPSLRPVLSLRSAVAQLKEVPAGSSLGYGRTFTTKRNSVIATVPIGYHDGYRRALSNRARVIVNGKFAPVVGRVSMDWTIIDVTDAAPVSLGDEVILIGESGGLRITAEELAGYCGTISYEITCGIGRRVPRVSSGTSRR